MPYLAAALLLAGGGLCFYELFLSVGRHSFFTFQSDFLACFMPWNAHLYMYPGQPYGSGDLLTAFAGQFYRGWGAVAYQVAAGLLWVLLFTFLCRILWVNRLREGIGKKLVLWGLPAFWALVFLTCQVGLAFSNQNTYWGFKDYKLGRILMKTERLVMENRYEEALQLADRYWFSHPCSIDDVVTGRNSLYAGLSQTEILFRLDLAAYTRVALLGAHRLNEDFFTYYRVPEIYGQIEEAGAPAGTLISVFRNRLTGNHTAVYSQIMNVMETEGMSYFLLEQSVFSALACQQYGLADKYIRLLENTLFYRKDASLYRQVSEYLQHRTATASPKTRALAEQIKRERNKSLTDYIYTSGSGEAEARELWRQRPAASLENLEYIALTDLLYKRTDSVMARMGDYLRLSGQTQPPYRLPAAWQEMLLVVAEERRGQLPPQVEEYMRHLAWNNALVKQCRMFYGERERLRRGMSSPQQITQAFGHTFAYNYYFSRFVTPRQDGNHALAH
ncbi:MAG: hypothetical protein K2I87_04705 [Bacteroidales bacterium]|nr:hypothetical protein [Bacteroidales bacterium]